MILSKKYTRNLTKVREHTSWVIVDVPVRSAAATSGDGSVLKTRMRASIFLETALRPTSLQNRAAVSLASGLYEELCGPLCECIDHQRRERRLRHHGRRRTRPCSAGECDLRRRFAIDRLVAPRRDDAGPRGFAWTVPAIIGRQRNGPSVVAVGRWSARNCVHARSRHCGARDKNADGSISVMMVLRERATVGGNGCLSARGRACAGRGLLIGLITLRTEFLRVL